MEQTHLPTLFWIVAGKNGMELWGYHNEGALGLGSDKVPDARIKLHPLHWDFSFTGHDGSGGQNQGWLPIQSIQMVESFTGI